MKMIEQTIRADDDGIRVDRWFKRHLPQITHGVLQKAVRKKDVRLDGARTDTNVRLSAGQVLRFPEEWRSAPKPVAKTQTANITANQIADLEAAIIHEDAQILVLNKPVGLAVQGGTGQSKSVDDILRARAAKRKEEAPRLVHRLDRDTSGVLVLGKTANAAAELASSFAKKKARKLYWALVRGTPRPEEGKIDLALLKSVGEDGGGREKVRAHEDGKEAVTIYRVVERAGTKLSWVEMEPVTGRTHQLRVHMTAIGHPILGDGKYGGADAFLESEGLAKQLHLHAAAIQLPFKGRELEFYAPLPKHMQKSWDYLGFDT